MIVYFLCAPLVRSQSKALVALAGFVAGAGGLFLATTFTALSLYFSGKSFLTAGQALLLAHLPLMAVEGVHYRPGLGIRTPGAPCVVGPELIFMYSDRVIILLL